MNRIVTLDYFKLVKYRGEVEDLLKQDQTTEIQFKIDARPLTCQPGHLTSVTSNGRPGLKEPELGDRSFGTKW